MNGLNILKRPLFYEASLASRERSAVERVVIHCTELPDMETAREYGERIHHEDSGTGNCGHFYIDRDGAVEQWVALERVAHHVRGHNENSVGIELVNLGRFPNWFDSHHQHMAEDYPPTQLAALVSLLKHLCEALPALREIAGHEDLDRERIAASDNPGLRIQRKLDPGPRFPWPKIMEQVPLIRVKE